MILTALIALFTLKPMLKHIPLAVGVLFQGDENVKRVGGPDEWNKNQVEGRFLQISHVLARNIKYY